MRVVAKYRGAVVGALVVVEARVRSAFGHSLDSSRRDEEIRKKGLICARGTIFNNIFFYFFVVNIE